jgi:hypothetical protein
LVSLKHTSSTLHHIDPFVFAFQKYFKKNLKFFYFFPYFKLIFFSVPDHFDMLVSKIIYKK